MTKGRYTIVVVIAVFSAFLFYVWQKIYLIQLGYHRDRLKKEIYKWEEANSKILLKVGTSSALVKIDSLARNKLGMVSPNKNDIIFITCPLETDRDSNRMVKNACAGTGMVD